MLLVSVVVPLGSFVLIRVVLSGLVVFLFLLILVLLSLRVRL